MNKMQEMFKIADIHVHRIEQAIRHIGHLFPLSSAAIENIAEEDFVWVELLVHRFGKLQDYIGSKLIDTFFITQKEIVDRLTMIDKLNKLERFEIIENVESWSDMRDLRNYLAHEYPENADLTAEALNSLYSLTPTLLKILENLKSKCGFLPSQE
jgi:hypothetical protein